MHRQVGDLTIDDAGLARRGLLVRHLVLPGGLAGTREFARWLAEEISPDTFVNIMPQYRPVGAVGYAVPDTGPAELTRPLAVREYREAMEQARAAGLRRLDGW
jgi:putative pyruvate formate lyase activating enzyme